MILKKPQGQDKKIEELRLKMYRSFHQNRNGEEVLTLSQELDELLNKEFSNEKASANKSQDFK